MTMPTITGSIPAAPLVDEHSILLWQACAYADEVTDAAGSAQAFAPARYGMLTFLHYRLLPYLATEESRLRPTQLRDTHMADLLVMDHQRIRADVENVESSRSRDLASLAAQALVARLARHIQREQIWVADATAGAVGRVDTEDWELLLRMSDDIDVDSLPTNWRQDLLLRRLQAMHRGETLSLHASRNLHDLWQRQYAVDRDSHGWVYEQDGPRRWDVRITRRDSEALHETGQSLWLDSSATDGAHEEPDMGGDAACWAHLVCPQCGRLNADEHPETCEACGAAWNE